MQRSRSAILIVSGLVLAILAWCIPAYLRAVDGRVLAAAGADSPTVIVEARRLLDLEKVGPAEMIHAAIEPLGIEGSAALKADLDAYRDANPSLARWGGPFPFLERTVDGAANGARSVIEILLPEAARVEVIAFLESSRRPGVRVLLEGRELVRPTVFPPVGSSAGQALEVAVVAMALLSQGDHLDVAFRNEVEGLASAANRGHDSRPLERVYLDLLSLAKRMNWGQLTALMSRIESVDALAGVVRFGVSEPDGLKIVFAAVWLAESGERVVGYLKRYRETGLLELRNSLAVGRGGLIYLLDRRARLYPPDSVVVPYERMNIVNRGLGTFVYFGPLLAAVTKYLALMFGAFFVTRGVWFLVATKYSEDPFPAGTLVTLRRQQALSFVILLSFMIFGEPYLAQEPEPGEPDVKIKFPVANAAVLNKLGGTMDANINEITILALVVFFLVQASIYSFCLIKLREIKRQRVNSRLKIRLLDNEDNMFDAGLYVGLGGTVLSLVLLALGVIKPSLMAAYASTLFGIVFVSVLKIFHVRPFRRKLIIESEMPAA